MLVERNLNERSIAYDSVQDLRDRIFIRDVVGQPYRKLHCYVPFYFAMYPPMSYVQRTRGILNDIVFFVVSRSILNDPSVLFTDGNASMQQLSRSSGERVGIVPATKSEYCSRLYKPDGPYGTNQSFSNFYRDITFLGNLNWDIINSVYHMDPFEEDKRIRSAEVLVSDKLSLTNIQRIAVCTEKTAIAVRTIAKECGLAGFASFVTADPSLFRLP
jgi:ssDNA thymidine ADP-ribosyltransferase, DarT